MRPFPQRGLDSGVSALCVLLLVLASDCGGDTYDADPAHGGAAGGPDAAADSAANGASDDYVICDGSSDLRLGFQVLPGGKLEPGAVLLVQNGHVYLFVDGSCRYWVYGTSGLSNLQGWQAARTGVMPASEASQLSKELDAAHWSSLSENGPCLDAPLVAAYRLGAVVLGKPCQESGVIYGLNKMARGWVDRLWSEGTDVDGPVRFLAIAVPPEMDWYSVTSSLGVNLAPLALPFEQGVTFGLDDPALLVTDPNIMAQLRKERARVIAGDFLTFDGDTAVLPVRQDGVLYFVYFRDTIPMEDATGLIRPPSPP